MKVLMINGSPHEKGCTYTALNEIAISLQEEGIDSEIIYCGNQPINDCTACGICRKTGLCIYNDVVNEIIEKAKTSDGFIFGSPVYYAHPSGRILSVLDRVFYSGSQYFAFKPGASVISARRAGTTTSFDVLNKYFTINQMPIVSSSYWNMVHGNTPDEVKQDLEGLQTMRNLGKNMAWLLKCIANGEKHPNNKKISTNFIR